MKSVKDLLYWWKEDYRFKTMSSAFGSLAVTVLFALYNGFLGMYHSSLWYDSICVYYLLLSLIRAVLLLSERKIARIGGNTARLRRRVFLVSHLLIFLMNVSLVVPISLMVKLQKPVNMTLIPAIAMAAYTTIKIVAASVNMKKKSKSDNLLLQELRTISFIDALLSIIVLQNTLIVVNSKGENSAMLIVSAVTSAVILAGMIGVGVFSFLSGLKKKT